MGKDSFRVDLTASALNGGAGGGVQHIMEVRQSRSYEENVTLFTESQTYSLLIRLSAHAIGRVTTILVEAEQLKLKFLIGRVVSKSCLCEGPSIHLQVVSMCVTCVLFFC